MDLQTHVLDWLDYVFGPAISVAGNMRRQTDVNVAEDLVSYSIGFESVVANGICAYSTNQTSEVVTIHGSKASASMSFFSTSPIIMSQNGVRTVHDLRDPAHVHQPLVARVVAHLIDGSENPSPAKAARRTAMVMEKLYN